MDLIDIYFACWYTSHSPETLVTMSRKGQFPTVYELGRRVWKVSAEAFAAWVEDCAAGAGDASPSESRKYRQAASSHRGGPRHAS